MLQWVAFSLLLFLGGWVILVNWTAPMRPKGASLIPAIGGLFAAVAFAIAPFDALHGLWWVPLIVDLGCVTLLALTMGHVVYLAVSRKE